MSYLLRATKYFLILGIIIVLVILASFIFERTYPYHQLKFGVTFSPKYARYLNLDWQKTYLQILDELKIKNLRIPSYWNSLEKEAGKYDFSETDFMLTEGLKRGVRIMLVVGGRQPRWPECHLPSWAKLLSISERHQKTFELIQRVVERYRDNSAIWAYQVENEPFAWWFGENCDPPDKKFLQQEVALVKKLDKRPVVITDSGEWGLWVDAITPADILGSSVYTKAYNSNLHIYMPYLFPAYFYQLKAVLIKRVPNQQNKKILVTELQAEPWLSGKDPKENLPQNQTKSFSLSDFKANIEFVKKIGFEENYLWGVEWWFWMSENGYPEYLEYAKTLFR